MKIESFIEDYSYEDMTNMEAEFLLVLVEVVEDIIKAGDKVTLKRISVATGITTEELSDYLSHIIEMEKQLRSRYERG